MCRLTIFVNKASGEILNDAGVNARIIAAVEKAGADALVRKPTRRTCWAISTTRQNTSRSPTFSMSGLIQAPPMPSPCVRAKWPADVYLEGSDQHRGWFQSSLLEALRHARARALQGGRDPRLHCR